MKTEYIRIYKSVHTWTGIISGMALFIAFYAGSLTVFKEPLQRWVAPPVESRLVPLEEAQVLIVKTLEAKPEVAKDFTIHLVETENVPARMGWRMRDGEGDDHDESAFRYYSANLDTEGGAQIEEITPSALGSFIDVLHRVVGLPVDNDENRWIMGVIATLYALALFSGVIVLLPTLVADFFALRIGKNLKRMWLDAHNVVGIISLPFHMIMVLTAAVFAFHDGIYGAQNHLLHGGKLSFERPPVAAKGPAPARNPADMLPPLALVEKVRALSPTFEPVRLQYQKIDGPRPLVRVWGMDGTAVRPRAVGGFTALDPYSGKVVSSDFMPGLQNVPNVTIASFFALHMAAFGGATVKWLYFLLGLAGAWLFYSGNLLWVESRRKRASRQSSELPVQRRDTRLMAAASVGVCVGCICGISLSIVAGKWLYGHVSDLNAWHKGLYYIAFFAAIAWAFVRGAGVAAVHLLWSAAALTLAIPVTSLLAWSLPSLGLWAHTSAAAFGVDATALVMAFGFAWMARATTRRVRNGTEDSVWSDSVGVTPVAPQAREAAV